MTGHVKIDRQILESMDVMTLPVSQRWLWIVLLIEARWSHEPRQIPGGPVHRGEALLSVRRLADIANVTPKVAHLALNSFQRRGMIRVQDRGQLGRIITILNYDKFQSPVATTGDTLGDTQGYTSGYTSGYNPKKGKKGKKEDLSAQLRALAHRSIVAKASECWPAWRGGLPFPRFRPQDGARLKAELKLREPWQVMASVEIGSRWGNTYGSTLSGALMQEAQTGIERALRESVESQARVWWQGVLSQAGGSTDLRPPPGQLGLVGTDGGDQGQPPDVRVPEDGSLPSAGPPPLLRARVTAGDVQDHPGVEPGDQHGHAGPARPVARGGAPAVRNGSVGVVPYQRPGVGEDDGPRDGFDFAATLRRASAARLAEDRAVLALGDVAPRESDSE